MEKSCCLTYSTDSIPTLIVQEKLPDSPLIEIQMWEAHITDRYSVRAKFLAKHAFDGALILKKKVSVNRVSDRLCQLPGLVRSNVLIQNRIPLSARFTKTNPAVLT